MGDYGNAMECLEHAMIIESERGDDSTVMTYAAMGDVLVAQEGREKEAILMFQQSCGLFEEGNLSEERMRLFLKLGQAYTKIEAWDDASHLWRKAYRLQTPLKMKGLVINRKA